MAVSTSEVKDSKAVSKKRQGQAPEVQSGQQTSQTQKDAHKISKTKMREKPRQAEEKNLSKEVQKVQVKETSKEEGKSLSAQAKTSSSQDKDVGTQKELTKTLQNSATKIAVESQNDKPAPIKAKHEAIKGASLSSSDTKKVQSGKKVEEKILKKAKVPETKTPSKTIPHSESDTPAKKVHVESTLDTNSKKGTETRALETASKVQKKELLGDVQGAEKASIVKGEIASASVSSKNMTSEKSGQKESPVLDANTQKTKTSTSQAQTVHEKPSTSAAVSSKVTTKKSDTKTTEHKGAVSETRAKGAENNALKPKITKDVKVKSQKASKNNKKESKQTHKKPNKSRLEEALQVATRKQHTSSGSMTKREKKIEIYTEDIKKHYGEVDSAFLAIIVKNLGPSIYRRDAEGVACSDKGELDTVRRNFLIKKLGLKEENAVLDKAIQEVCDEMKASRNKYRATFYYALAKKFKKESKLS